MLRYALLAAIGEEALVTGLDWTGRRRSFVLSVSSACAPRYLVYCACVFWCLVSVGVDVFPVSSAREGRVTVKEAAWGW